MATGYILILAIFILGGVIATVGDRIGTRVGKARLSLFKLRPKNTAVILTGFTGMLISASTLAILFAADDKLRQGVFELESIQNNLRQSREQLKAAQIQKKQVQQDLERSQQQLLRVDRNLQEANAKQKKTETQLNQTRDDLKRTAVQQIQTQSQLQITRTELDRVGQQYQQAIVALREISQQRKALFEQRQNLVGELNNLKAEREKVVAQANKAISDARTAILRRDRELAKRERTIQESDRKIADLNNTIQKRNQEIRSREKIISEREEIIAQKESRLKELETQQNYFEQEVAKLEKYYQSYRDLRLGKLALIRGQVLSAGVVRIEQPTSARQAVVQILQEANRNASLELAEPGINPNITQILHVTQEQVDQLSRQISDGKEYVVRIVSAGNYVRGEKRIDFFADAARNQVVFTGGEVLAATSANPKSMTSYQLRQRIELLISASQFRARNAGIVESLQIDGTFIRFVSQLLQYDQQLDIKVVAVEDTYTAGPLRVRLIAMQNGQVIFST